MFDFFLFFVFFVFVFFFFFFLTLFHQGSRQSPLLAKMGGDLGSPSFPPVKAVARALRARDSLPVQGGEALSPLVWGQLVFRPKKFFSTADPELYVRAFFCGAKKIIQNGAAGEKKIKVRCKKLAFTSQTHSTKPFLRSKKGKMAPQAKKN